MCAIGYYLSDVYNHLEFIRLSDIEHKQKQNEVEEFLLNLYVPESDCPRDFWWKGVCVGMCAVCGEGKEVSESVGSC